MSKLNQMTYMACDTDYEESDIVLFGAPFDGTTTFRPGTRFAPDQIRIDSFGLETYSPFLDEDLLDRKISDIGDVELPFGNPKRVMEALYEQTKEIIRDKKVPFMIGGEHLVSFPAIKAVHEAHPGLRVIHFDAHADLRRDYMEEALSHSTVMRQVWSLIGDGKIYQFGIRSGLREEFAFAEAGHTVMNKFTLSSLPLYIDELMEHPIYVTIDLDVLDPSCFPGTGTPEPGGIQFKELQEAFAHLKKLNIVGADVVELSPHYDTSGISTAAACKTIRELLLSI